MPERVFSKFRNHASKFCMESGKAYHSVFSDDSLVLVLSHWCSVKSKWMKTVDESPFHVRIDQKGSQKSSRKRYTTADDSQTDYPTSFKSLCRGRNSSAVITDLYYLNSMNIKDLFDTRFYTQLYHPGEK